MIRQTLSHYRIVEKLGSGGMGEVYVAEDTKLSRKVALKVLPPDMAEDAERRARFELEAKAVAALDHPNIVTIYSVEEAEGVHFYTMQWVKGKTLTELIPKKGMSLNKFFEIAIPLADAVSAAHEKGIIHRDLKPDNLMVSDEGRLKILDFGLAKLKPGLTEEGASELPTQSATAEGRIVGTVAYMSPEQAEGKQIDHRSDIFSMGIILYEMATGERPFKGDTAASLLSAILKDTPPSATEVNPSVPRDLGKIIRRCLVKDTEHRYQTAKDVRNELEELKQEVDSGDVFIADQVLKPPRRRGRRAWLSVAAAVLAMTVGTAAWLYRSYSESPPASSRTVPVTGSAGMEWWPALSPDGGQVAFVWKREGEEHFHLYVKMIEGGEPLQLTDGSAIDYSPVWSPDGTQIAFLRLVEYQLLGQGKSDVLVIPALGGPELRLGSLSTSEEQNGGWNPGLAWSPDGRFLAVVDKASPEKPHGIFLLSIESGEKLRLSSPPPGTGYGDKQPALSPDGHTVAFIRMTNLLRAEIYLQPLSGGEAELLTADEFITDLDWVPDGSAIVFSSGSESEAGSHLSSIPVSGGTPNHLPFGEMAATISIAREGARLAYDKRSWFNANIWRIDGPGSEERGPPTKLISSSRADWGQEYSPDGMRIAFASERGGTNNIWTCDSDGTNCAQLTRMERAINPRWSPDGMRVASLGSEEDSSYGIYITEIEGGFTTRRLAEDGRPGCWSRDGRWIYFTSNRSGEYQIWKMPAEGGDPVQVTQKGGIYPEESENGGFLYYTDKGGTSAMRRVPVGGGEELPIMGNQKTQSDCWTLWRHHVLYLFDDDENKRHIDLFDLETRQVKRLFTFEPEPFWDFSPYSGGLWSGMTVSPDGRWILISVEPPGESDIMLVENFHY